MTAFSVVFWAFVALVPEVFAATGRNFRGGDVLDTEDTRGKHTEREGEDAREMNALEQTAGDHEKARQMTQQIGHKVERHQLSLPNMKEETRNAEAEVDAEGKVGDVAAGVEEELAKVVLSITALRNIYLISVIRDPAFCSLNFSTRRICRRH